MPTLRPSRRRGRKPKGFTPAELEYLTGEPQNGANKFERLCLNHPNRPDQFERVESVLERAAGIVPPERIEELRRELAGRRDRHQRYRDDPAAAWREDSAKYDL